MTKTLLIKNARVVVTMDEQRREIADGGVFIRDNVIAQVGPMAELPQTADEIIDASRHVVLPGLVNTHHHMYQSLTRVIPAAQNGELFNWLTNLYPIWSNLTAEMVHASALTAMSELILSGCTTSSDHLYIYPNDCRLEDTIEAAREIGMRFHAARGSMSVGQSKGGLPPDSVVEEEGAILRDTQRLIETYHDAGRYAMQRIVVAPCSPFSVSRDLMKEAAALARSHGVSLHTHLAENVNDIAYSREKFNMTPAQYAEDCGWVGHDVWHAHCVQLDDHGIQLFGRTGTGVAHCPCSNMRLASGIAPIGKMRAHGVPVGLGVDGCASNDAGHMLGEARQAMLLQRVGFGPDAMTARQALELATLGGAKVLNRDDIGALKPGMAADMVLFQLDQIGFAGALHDPVAALVFCTPSQVSYSIINGKVVVRDGQLQTVDLPLVIERHNRLARQLALAAGSRPA
ncbi:8-oxoguanine deaminase [Massilia sp. NR 4-1]|uniref:8-oxoguanine deaminase n=1 Tax=Massilia sp. NR 4-1 TaxID=1678028 RepID=UPI00067B616D|nr:8-oxoguanine deaminase [Massilia sp. NR 4-1]AKU21703.1 hydroxydechloroatrazine ethylaminohydrolase [Massilia sp. NR 4-1]